MKKHSLSTDIFDALMGLLIAGELFKAHPLKKDATALVLVSVLVLVQTGTLLLDLHHIVRHNNVT